MGVQQIKKMLVKPKIPALRHFPGPMLLSNAKIPWTVS